MHGPVPFPVDVYNQIWAGRAKKDGATEEDKRASEQARRIVNNFKRGEWDIKLLQSVTDELLKMPEFENYIPQDKERK